MIELKRIWKTNKKLVLGVTAGVTAAAIGCGFWYQAGHSNSEPVYVYPFHYVGMTEYWGDSQESHGPVTTDKIQTVFLSDTQTVTEILVQQGDQVKKGDLLMTFDTTLSDLQLERKRLGVETLKLQLEDAKDELKRINSMKPMVIPPPAPPADPDAGTKNDDNVLYPKQQNGNVNGTVYDGSSADKALIFWLLDGESISNRIFAQADKHAAAIREAMLPVVPDPGEGGGETTNPDQGSGETTNPDQGSGETTNPDQGGGETTNPDQGGGETTNPDQGGGETTNPDQGSGETTNPDQGSGETTNPDQGGGETTNPDQGGGETTNPDQGGDTTTPGEGGGGTTTTGEGGGETPDPSETAEETTDPSEGEGDNPAQSSASGTGSASLPNGSTFYVVIKVTQGDMSLGDKKVWQCLKVTKSHGEYSFTFADTLIADYSIPAGGEDTSVPEIDMGSGYTASQIAQMRSDQKKKIKDLEFQVKMAEAEYKITLKEVTDGNIYAENDGKVISLLTEEEAKTTKQPILKVSGGGGFYVEGFISELEKDNMKIGQEVTINDWNTGMTYTGYVDSIGEFPTREGYFSGNGNPNASFYPFMVFVDETADLRAGSYVSVQYSNAESKNGIYLENPFLRTEKGRSYVLVLGADGKLEQRWVTTGKSLWGNYTEILSNLSAEDLVAFPYGKNVKPGVPAQEGDMSNLYG